MLKVLPVASQTELSERYSMASESGSSTDSHVENLETKDGEIPPTHTHSTAVTCRGLVFSLNTNASFPSS